MPWTKERLHTPVFLPGDFMDRGAWWATVQGVTEESDMTERLTLWLPQGVQLQTVFVSRVCNTSGSNFLSFNKDHFLEFSFKEEY